MNLQLFKVMVDRPGTVIT